jgi:hypothetical protein
MDRHRLWLPSFPLTGAIINVVVRTTAQHFHGTRRQRVKHHDHSISRDPYDRIFAPVTRHDISRDRLTTDSDRPRTPRDTLAVISRSNTASESSMWAVTFGSIRLLSSVSQSFINLPSCARLPHPYLHRNTLTFHRTLSTLNMSSFYSLKATLPGNKIYDFSQLQDKVVLIVNVASAWYVSQPITPRPTRRLNYDAS